VVFQALTDVPADTAPGPAVVSYDSYLTRSTDNGATWSSPAAISKVSRTPTGPAPTAWPPSSSGLHHGAHSSHVYAAWTDSRNASPWAAVDAFRAGTGPEPNVITQCPTTFGEHRHLHGVVSP
jgi:hypothetical protein